LVVQRILQGPVHDTVVSCKQKCKSTEHADQQDLYGETVAVVPRVSSETGRGARDSNHAMIRFDLSYSCLRHQRSFVCCNASRSTWALNPMLTGSST
jgi:hypothetical protein